MATTLRFANIVHAWSIDVLGKYFPMHQIVHTPQTLTPQLISEIAIENLGYGIIILLPVTDFRDISHIYSLLQTGVALAERHGCSVLTFGGKLSMLAPAFAVRTGLRSPYTDGLRLTAWVISEQIETHLRDESRVAVVHGGGRIGTLIGSIYSTPNARPHNLQMYRNLDEGIALADVAVPIINSVGPLPPDGTLSKSRLILDCGTPPNAEGWPRTDGQTYLRGGTLRVNYLLSKPVELGLRINEIYPCMAEGWLLAVSDRIDLASSLSREKVCDLREIAGLASRYGFQPYF